MLPSDDWILFIYLFIYLFIFSNSLCHCEGQHTLMDTSKSAARSEQPGDLLCDRVKVNVVETGSGWQTWHGAHLRGNTRKAEELYWQAE